ncbi:DNA replication/repair protein RecF [Desulfolucanica intricata]|uniref:DNA replication/repair protein RecF n=1 Tax=Desulfolucanica intricata TaxID=1285191 RepID=UPI000836AFC3|nr:DNA replication/repair protein RecF [Desulfolucanica intricata]
MRITDLCLKNFRNYRNLHFKPGNNLNILVGDNAQGKTNLLEAVYLTLKGRSFRTSREKDIINFDSQKAKLKANVFAFGQDFVIDLIISRNKGKVLKINDFSSSNKKFAANFGTVLFTPDHLSVIKGSPQERRRFLDLELSGFYPHYNYYLSNYQKVLAQRNNLLKDIRDKKQSNSSLYLWDEQLFEYGSKIIASRFEILKRLIPVAQKIHNQITSSQERLTIRYLSSLNLSELNSKFIFEQFKAVSLKIREQELYRAQTLVGPHRDDLGFFIANQSISSFGSQGQQRTLILTLKLALIELWKNELKEVPVILLDDVFFELDCKRQKYILELINQDIQVFITTTNIDNIVKYGYNNTRIFYIRDGFIDGEE